MTDEKQTHLSWRDGLPTKPDVDALEKRWAELPVGTRLSKDDIAAETGSPSSTRLRTVIEAWRKRLMQRGVDLQCERGTGFYYVATPEQIIGDSQDVLSSMARRSRRHRMRLNVAGTQAADDKTRSTVEHQGRLFHAIERETRKGRMNLLPPTAAPTAPQITAPNNKKSGER